MGPLGTVFPEYQVTFSGRQVTVHCSSTTPARWMINGNILPIIGALVIKNITEKDSGQYTCHGHLDIYGSIPFKVASTIIVATVQKKQKYVDIKRGMPAILNCTTTTTALWFFERNRTLPVSPPVSRKAQWLVARSTEWRHGGYYYCFGSNSHGKTHFLKLRILRVFDVKALIHADEGQNMTLTCKNTGGNITWQKAGSEYVLSTLSKLQLTNIGTGISGDFFCTESFTKGLVKNTYFPMMVVARNDGKLFPTKQAAKIGKSVTFYCENGKNGRWKFNNKRHFPDNVFIQNGTGWTSLTVHNATPLNEGTYKCYGYLYKKPVVVSYGSLQVLDHCPERYYSEKIIEMATFAGPDNECISKFDKKIFEDPDPANIKEGLWVARNPTKARIYEQSSAVTLLYYTELVYLFVACLIIDFQSLLFV